MKAPAAALAVLLLAGGCAEQRLPPPAPPPAPPPPTNNAELRAHKAALDRAHLLESEGRLREALWWVRVAEATSPNRAADAAEAASLEGKLRQAVAEALSRAQQLGAQGAGPRAAQAYLVVLELDPTNPVAREALRSADRALKLRAIERGGGGGPAAGPVKRGDGAAATGPR
jgi:hypothetical protein